MKGELNVAFSELNNVNILDFDTMTSSFSYLIDKYDTFTHKIY